MVGKPDDESVVDPDHTHAEQLAESGQVLGTLLCPELRGRTLVERLADGRLEVRSRRRLQCLTDAIELVLARDRRGGCDRRDRRDERNECKDLGRHARSLVAPSAPPGGSDPVSPRYPWPPATCGRDGRRSLCICG